VFASERLFEGPSLRLRAWVVVLAHAPCSNPNPDPGGHAGGPAGADGAAAGLGRCRAVAPRVKCDRARRAARAARAQQAQAPAALGVAAIQRQPHSRVADSDIAVL